MKNMFKALLVMMVMLLVACGGKTEDKKETATTTEVKTLLVGTNPEFPPFEYKHEGKVVGFDIDLINAIAKEAGFKVEIKEMSFDGLIPALQAGKIDMSIAGMTATDERRKAIDFSKSYYTANQVIIVNSDNETVKEFNDLKGKKIGVVLGFTADLVASKIEGAEVVKFDSASGVIMAIKDKKVDAVIFDEAPAQNFVKNNEGLKVVKAAAEAEEYAIALPKGNEELLGKINKSLETLMANGTYDELIKKHFNK